MAADWEEIKRLAADLQRAQLGSTVQRLSDRNCIEIVGKLIEVRLLDVVFTTDGKEYVTPQQVLREIKDELYVHGGRINLVDLAQILNIDFSQIEARVAELVKSEHNLSLTLGQLIDSEYLDHLCEEINERLQQAGQVTLGELTKQYDLPTDFLQEAIDVRLGTTIQAEIDPFDSHLLYTSAFITRNKARVLGALTAITQPTPILSIINRLNIQERIFHTIVDELTNSGRLAGSVSGGRQDRAVYIPDIYSKAQNEWIDSFYKQNGYLEYDSLSRLGISEPQSYIKKRFKQENLTFLPTVAVGRVVTDQIEATVDEALSSGSWIDIMPILPSVLSSSDAQQLLQAVLKARGRQSVQTHIFCNTFVANEKFIQELIKPFDKIMATKAEKDAQKGLHFSSGEGKTSTEGESKKDSKKEERRKKAAGGKSGGGTQGRETKTKAVKKKYRTRDSDDDDEEEEVLKPKGGRQQEIEFLKVDQIVEELQKHEILEDCPEEFLTELAEHIHRPLTKSYQEVVRSVMVETAAAKGALRRKTHSDLQEKINGLLVNVRLFEKGLKHFPDDTQTQLSKYLLKTIGADIANLIFSYMAQEHMISLGQEASMTPEIRGKLINKFPESVKEPLSELHSSLNGKSVEDFLSCIETASGHGVCDMIIKKLDKKKERQTSFGHRQALLEQLSGTLEAALALHQVVLILFQIHTGCILHASGKFVPQILSFLHLQSFISEEAFQLLQTYQGLVIKQLTSTNDEELHDVKVELEELLPKVKEVATVNKRTSQSEQD